MTAVLKLDELIGKSVAIKSSRPTAEDFGKIVGYELVEGKAYAIVRTDNGRIREVHLHSLRFPYQSSSSF